MERNRKKRGKTERNGKKGKRKKTGRNNFDTI